MKLNYLMPLALLATAASFQVMAEGNVKYIFQAKDNSVETRLCVASASDDLLKLKNLIRKDKYGGRNIARHLTCNNKDITGFSAQYNAQKTTEYLNRYAPEKYKIDLDNVQIIDLAYDQSAPQIVKIISVSSK